MNANSAPTTGRWRGPVIPIAGALAAVVWVVGAAAVSTAVGAASSRVLSAAAGGDRAAADRWYVIKIAGNPAGYVHDQVESRPATRAAGTAAPSRLLVTTSEMRLVLNRLGVRIEMRLLSSADESADGRLLRTSYVMLASNQSTRSDAVVGDGGIEVTNEAGGRTYTNTLTFTGPLFGPEAIRRACAGGLKQPGDKVTVQTFIPEAGLVGDLTRVVLGRENVTVEGRPVPALKVEETFEGMPVKRTGWLDLEGNLLKQEEPGPFGLMEVARVQKSTALAAASGAELPAEIYEKSIVRTNIRLPRYAPIDRLKLRLTHRNPALGWPDFMSGNQTVREKTDKALVLEIRRPAEPKGMRFPAAVNAENRQFIEPNAYIQSDDAEIRKLAGELAGEETDALKAAFAMERWTAEHMTFDLGIVFAPATEVFQSRRGTCVGYATILATLARAAGIPSRIAMGYVYAQGMFGGHAWAEILAGKEWIPLDAAIVNEGVADAAHLAIITSSLAGGPGELSVGAAQQIFGQVDIGILEYESAGKTTAVPSEARPYVVEGNRYFDPWLGLALTKPGDFAFVKLDAIWPDATIVGLSGPKGEKASLEEQPVFPWQELPEVAVERLAKVIARGKRGTVTAGEGPAKKSVPAVYASNGQAAAAAFGRGASLFMLKVEGDGAASLLRRLAAGVRLD